MLTNWVPSALLLLAVAAVVASLLLWRVLRPANTEIPRDSAGDDRETRIAFALQGSNDGLWHWNVRTAALYLSPRVYELLAREVGGVEPHIQVFGKLLHPEDRRRAKRSLMQHLRGSEPFQGEYRLRRPPETYRWFRLRGHTVRDGNGQPLQMAGSITDVNEQRLAQEAVGRHALQQGLLSELGQFALDSPELGELLRQSVAVVTRGLGSEFCRLLITGADAQFLELKAASGWDEKWSRQTLFDPVAETEDRFIIGVRDAVIIEDFDREARFRPSRMLSSHAIHSAAELLICGVRDTYGVLGVYSRIPAQFTQEHVGFLRAVGSILAASMDRNWAQELLTAQEVRSRQSEERLRQIADSLPAMIAYWDSSGICRFANEAHFRQVGIPSRDMVGKAFGEVFGTPYGAAREAFAAVLRGSRQLFDMSGSGVDGAVRHWQGEYLPHWASGEVVGFYALVVDITERKTAEERLARQEALLAATGRMGEIGGWEIDSHDLVPQLSEMACRIHDLPAGASLDREAAAKFYSPESWEIVTRSIAEAFKFHKPFDYVVPFVSASGRHRWIRSIGEPQVVSGQCLRVVCAIQDVTQHKTIEAELAQSQKLESIGQLSAGIAHEINTPTQFIGNNIGFLKDAVSDIFNVMHKIKDVADGSCAQVAVADLKATLATADLDYLLEEVPRAIQQSLDGIERIQTIVSAMKEFSHPAMEKSPVDINHAIGSTIIVASNEWKYVAEMVTDLEPDLPSVPVIPGSFNQVILNIIVNAAHAVGEVMQGGSLGKGKITVATRRVENWAEIRIQDTGCGIPDKIRDRIFDPFFTTKAVGKGTGQGLAIAHDVVVKKHGGVIAVESEPGLGTTFIVRLPLAASAAAVIAA